MQVRLAHATAPRPLCGRGAVSLWGRSSALALPAVLAAALASYLVFHPAVRGIPALFWTFVVASGGLLAWTVALWESCRRTGRTLVLDLALRRPHGIQILAQGTLIAWWGWFVRPVYEFVPFIAAQLLLAFALEALFALTRRGRHAVGFGPVPVVFSLNLFLWFHFQWFFFQLAMVALVYVGKEFIRRHVAGVSRHIFNPSAFALAIAAVALIVTGQTGITQGEEIARSQFVPPHIFLVIFLVALPGQLLFGVAAMTMPAVLVIFGYAGSVRGMDVARRAVAESAWPWLDGSPGGQPMLDERGRPQQELAAPHDAPSTITPGPTTPIHASPSGLGGAGSSRLRNEGSPERASGPFTVWF